MAVTNTFPGGEDDDGAAAVPTAHRDRAMSPEEFDKLPRERPQNAPTSPAAPKPPRVFTDSEVRDMHAKLDTLDLDKAGGLYDWMAGRDLHTRGGGAPTEEGTEPVTATTRLAVRLAATAQDPATTIENLSWLREFADGRGLLKTMVSPKSTLAVWLSDQKAARMKGVMAKSDNAQAMQAAAADSWNPADATPEPNPQDAQ
jgi:hypothetical protein